MTAPVHAALVLTCVLGLMVVTGLVVNRLMARLPANADDWLDAPVVGLSFLVLALQALVTAGVRLRVGSWVVVVVLAAMAMLAARQGRARGLLTAFPRGALPLVLLTLMVHGAGMAIAGLAFAGRGWGDQFNYTALAHYLTEYRLGDTPPLTAPVALVGAEYGHLRIGQSILQGWLAVVLPIEPKTAFEPLILLGPVLTGLALAATGRVLGASRGVYLFASAGAVLPALATIHLEGFLSQALAVPLVLHLPALLARSATRGSVGAHGRVALVYTATGAIYPEYLPLAAAMLLASLVACWPILRAPARHVGATAIVLALPFVLGAARGLNETFGFLTVPLLAGLYPYALQAEGVGRLWFGDVATLPRLATPAAAAGAFLLGSGLYGLGRFVTETLPRRRTDSAAALQLAVALCLLGVVALPFAALTRGSGYAYQFYKTLMGAAPVLGWSAAFTFHRLLVQPTRPWRQRCGLGACAVLTIAPALATVDMSVAAARPALPAAEHARRRQTTAVMLDTSLLQAAADLEARRDGAVFLCATDTTWNAAHANAWLAYAARRTPVYALNPRLNDQHVRSIDGTAGWLGAAVPTAGDLLVTGGPSGWLDVGERGSTAGPKPYSAGAWGDRTMGLCSPLLGNSAEERPVLTLDVAGTEVALTTTRATTAVLMFREDRASTPGVRIAGAAGATAATSGRGWAALAIPLGAGWQAITLAAPGGSRVLNALQLFDAAEALPTPHVDNPNGVEHVSGRRFFWLGREPATVDYYSPVAGTAELLIEGIFGSSLVGTPRRRLAIAADGRDRTVVATAGAPIRAEVPVRPGWGRLSLQVLDAPDTVLTGDRRTLLYGVRSLVLRVPRPAAARAR